MQTLGFYKIYALVDVAGLELHKVEFATPSSKWVSREIDQLDERPTNIQGNVGDVLTLMR